MTDNEIYVHFADLIHFDLPIFGRVVVSTLADSVTVRAWSS